MNTVTRHPLASSERARAFCATLPRSAVRYRETWSGGQDIEITAGDVADTEGSVEPSARYIDIAVDLDCLSPLARQMAEHTPWPLNRIRNADFLLDTGKTEFEVRCLTDQQREVYAGTGQGPFRVAFHWPVINDAETGEQYYERCAKCAAYCLALMQTGFGAWKSLNLAGKVAQFSRPWSIDEEVAYQLRPECGCPGCDRRVKLGSDLCAQHAARAAAGQHVDGRRIAA
jgi:hypothetical protein